MIAGIDHRGTALSPQAFAEMWRFLTGQPPATLTIVPEAKVVLDGKVSGLGLDNRDGNFVTNLPLVGTTVDVYATHATSGDRITPALHTGTIGADGRWGPFVTDPNTRHEFVITAPGYAITHVYRSPFARSSQIVNLRPERIPDADRSVGAIVAMSRPAGYFGVPRDRIVLDGTSPPVGIPPGVAGRCRWLACSSWRPCELSRTDHRRVHQRRVAHRRPHLLALSASGNHVVVARADFVNGSAGEARAAPLQPRLRPARAASATGWIFPAEWVAIEGVVCSEPDREVEPLGLNFSVRGEAWTYHQRAFLVMNKPSGVRMLAKAKAPRERLFPLLPAPLRQRGVQAIGRLGTRMDDRRAALLPTTCALDPSPDLAEVYGTVRPKVYEVGCKHPVDAAQIEQLRQGVLLHEENETVRAAACEATGPSALRLTLTEGKYHQVKRMVAAAGNRVESLARSDFGGVRVDALAPGAWRWLSDEEATAVTQKRTATSGP